MLLPIGGRVSLGRDSSDREFWYRDLRRGDIVESPSEAEALSYVRCGLATASLDGPLGISREFPHDFVPPEWKH
jgi:hypothetical protein